MIKAFIKFINRGSVVDLAVGVIIGGAFGLIVNSFVNDLIMPLVGIFTGGIDFAGQAVKVGSAVVAYGKFIQVVVNFVLIAIVVFLIVQAYNKIHDRFEEKQQEEAKEEPSQEVVLLTQIRDLLKNNGAATAPDQTGTNPQE